MAPRNAPQKRSSTSSWLWIAVAVVLIVGIGATYMVMRANEQKTAEVPDVTPDTMMTRISEDPHVIVYFYSPT